MKLYIKILLITFVTIIFSSCNSYSVRNAQFQAQLNANNYTEADKTLDKMRVAKRYKRGKPHKNTILYLLDKGQMAYLQNNTTESLNLFLKASSLIEDQRKNVVGEVGKFLVNNTLTNYQTEDYENIMVHYYLAMNFISQKNYEDALVEVRQLNLKLGKLESQGNKRYKQDAFGHLIMGLIYEAMNDNNNAFIAYRNAYDIYKTTYAEKLATNIPKQLQYDMLKTAYKSGMQNEYMDYSREFNISYNPQEDTTASLVVFWENGLSPMKTEGSIEFLTSSANNSGYLTFDNANWGITQQIYVGNYSSQQQTALSNFSGYKIAYPKLIDRSSLLNSATIYAGNASSYTFEPIEDIGTIAHNSLKDNLGREIKTLLTRFVVKRAAEVIAEKNEKDKDKIVSSALNITNFLTEKADTRSWQSLPNVISYTRIPLKKGMNTLNLTYDNGKQEYINVESNGKGIEFYTLKTYQVR